MESKKPWHLRELDGDWIVVSADGKHVAHVLPQANELEVMGNARVITDGDAVSDRALVAMAIVAIVTLAAIAAVVITFLGGI